MANTKKYIESLFHSKGIIISPNKQSLFDEYIKSADCEAAVKLIVDTQNKIMENWKIIDRVHAIKSLQISVPNGTVGKKYEAKIDFKNLDLTDLIYEKFIGLEDIGLIFNKINDSFEGVPNQSGDLKIKFLFKILGEKEDSEVHEKIITIVVNPDPKSLWKDIPSDTNDPFWKEDDVSKMDSLGDRKIVVSSKRGRSHKNVGSFREDDFSYSYFENSGWALVAVSDGAGSYSLSRKGSQLACSSLVEYYKGINGQVISKELEEKLALHVGSSDDKLFSEIELIYKQQLYKAVVYVHNKLRENAEKIHTESPELFNNPKAKSILDYFHSTLIFALFKKYEFGYVFLTFGVGDCPIGLMNEEKTETHLLNWLDVGEFGGGTRFITQPEIFHSTEHPMSSRFNLKIVPDFSYLFLMSDGIYDPKFVVEANLEKNEKWLEFLNDLQGDNDDKAKIEFNPDNSDIASQLSSWMDFWSPGNHDDRTLAIVF
jgi:serine/threonine protein phosphatase PrpC